MSTLFFLNIARWFKKSPLVSQSPVRLARTLCAMSSLGAYLRTPFFYLWNKAVFTFVRGRVYFRKGVFKAVGDGIALAHRSCQEKSRRNLAILNAGT